MTTSVYTAAASQALFDTNGATWCGGGCGKCYNLTSTGSSACSSCGSGATAGTSIIVMVSNLCPYNGNEKWCPNVHQTNDYGYSYHFDIMAESEVFGDNAVVEFEPVACPGAATSDFETCECHGNLETDVTPVGMTSISSSSSSTKTSSATTASSSTSSTSSHTTLLVSTLTSASKKSSTTVSLATTTSAAKTSKTSAADKTSAAAKTFKTPAAAAVSSKSLKVVAAAHAVTATTSALTETSAVPAGSCPALTYTQTVWV